MGLPGTPPPPWFGEIFLGRGGFLGRYIARSLLKRGDHVSILGRNLYSGFDDSIKCIRADIRDRSSLITALKGQEIVFHVASTPGIWGKYKEFYSIDVKGTENVIFACYKNNVKKMIYTSSPSVVFNQLDLENADEQTPYPSKYLCHYSKTKAIAEKFNSLLE